MKKDDLWIELRTWEWHTGESKKPVCGDSRHDLNYPEIPNSWNNKEKTKMANFNEKVNRGIGYSLNSQEFFIYRTGTIKEFARMIHDDLYLLKNTYRLFIQYKTTHRVKKVAGRCFLWNGMEETEKGFDVESEEQGFGGPRFDGVASAVFITDKVVLAFGDARIVAAQMSRGEEYVYCDVYLCGRLVTVFKIPSVELDRILAHGY